MAPVCWLLIFTICNVMPAHIIPLPDLDVCRRTVAALRVHDDDIPPTAYCWDDSMRYPEPGCEGYAAPPSLIDRDRQFFA